MAIATNRIAQDLEKLTNSLFSTLDEGKFFGNLGAFLAQELRAEAFWVLKEDGQAVQLLLHNQDLKQEPNIFNGIV